MRSRATGTARPRTGASGGPALAPMLLVATTAAGVAAPGLGPPGRGLRNAAPPLDA
jgi:hypothetical protein